MARSDPSIELTNPAGMSPSPSSTHGRPRHWVTHIFSTQPGPVLEPSATEPHRHTGSLSLAGGLEPICVLATAGTRPASLGGVPTVCQAVLGPQSTWGISDGLGLAGVRVGTGSLPTSGRRGNSGQRCLP